MNPSKEAVNSLPVGSTERSAAKLNEMRGIGASDIFSPLTDEKLAVLTFLHIYHTADVVSKAVERDLSTLGLSVARYSILRMLTDREPVPLSWVAERHFTQRSNITAVVDRLARDGLVERVPDSVDRRVIRVQLTARGRETIDAARFPHLEFLAKIMSSLDQDEMRQLIDLLDKLSAPLDRKRLPNDL